MRKVLGGTRRQLLGQFLTETALLIVVSTVAAVLLCELALPFFNRIRDEQMERVCKVLKAALRRESQPLIPADPQNESSEI